MSFREILGGMAEEDKPLGAPIPSTTAPQGIPQQAEIPHRRLNWRAFFIGVIAVIGIEWFAFHALGTGNSKVTPTLIPSKVPPSPTQMMKLTADWSTYTDPAAGFSLQYPADKYTLDAKEPPSQGTLHIGVMKDTDPNINLGADFTPTEYPNLKTAIMQGTQFSSLQPGKKDTFKTMSLGTNNFVQVYPAEAAKCNCDEIMYITHVQDSFVVISMAKEIEASPSPKATATQIPNQISKLTQKEIQKRMLSDKEKLIIDQFGDIEKILTTFKVINNLDK